jgi:hypothetical protein
MGFEMDAKRDTRGPQILSGSPGATQSQLTTLGSISPSLCIAKRLSAAADCGRTGRRHWSRGGSSPHTRHRRPRQAREHGTVPISQRVVMTPARRCPESVCSGRSTQRRSGARAFQRRSADHEAADDDLPGPARDDSSAAANAANGAPGKGFCWRMARRTSYCSQLLIQWLDTLRQAPKSASPSGLRPTRAPRQSRRTCCCIERRSNDLIAANAS